MKASRLLDLALLGALGLLLLWWSWGKWPDVLVDFGQQLYVPWQLASGKVLYRDLAYLNGPLSPYAHTLLFRLFGPGLRVLVIANVVLLGVLVVVLHALLAGIGGRVSAGLACATFLLVFAFGQQLPIGNYNFVTPYAYEITHGVLLALAAVLFLGRYAQRGRLRDLAACGLCVGLTCLTKPEILVATVGAVSAGLVLTLWLCHPSGARRSVAVAVFAGALVAPVLVAVALLALALPLPEALADALGGLRWVLAPVVGGSRFYQAKMGLLDPSGALRTSARWTAFYGLWIGGAALLGALLPARVATARGAAVGLFLGLLAGLLFWRDQIPWTQALFPLPLFMLAACGAFIAAALRAEDRAQRARLVSAATLALLSLLLLAKIVLRVRPSHYGFALAMPATLLLIVVVWDWLLRAAPRAAGARRLLHAAFLAALVAFAAAQLRTTASFFARKTVPVGSGADAFWADARGNDVVRILGELATHVPPGATLAAVPDGPIINYLARRPSSWPHLLINPTAVGMYGEKAMLANLVQAPPDFILLIDWPMQEFGVAGFGDGYGEQLAAWIGANYRVVGSASGQSMALLRRAAGDRAHGPDHARDRPDRPIHSCLVPELAGAL